MSFYSAVPVGKVYGVAGFIRRTGRLLLPKALIGEKKRSDQDASSSSADTVPDADGSVYSDANSSVSSACSSAADASVRPASRLAWADNDGEKAPPQAGPAPETIPEGNGEEKRGDEEEGAAAAPTRRDSLAKQLGENPERSAANDDNVNAPGKARWGSSRALLPAHRATPSSNTDPAAYITQPPAVAPAGWGTCRLMLPITKSPAAAALLLW